MRAAFLLSTLLPTLISATTTEMVKHSGRTTREKILIAHAVCGAAACCVFIPLGVLIARWFRGHKWYPAHAGFHVVGAALIIACFGTGVHVSNAPHFPLSNPHKSVGLGLFLIIIVQVLLGIVAHSIPAPKLSDTAHYRLPTLSGKSPIRILHMIFGILTFIVGFAQVYLGMREFNHHTKLHVPREVIWVYWALGGVIALLYIGGWVKEAASGSRVYNLEGGEKLGSTDDHGGAQEQQ